jgi:plastocyanin
LWAAAVPAGEIRGKVIIKRPAEESSKIVSRSLIQKYVTKSSQHYDENRRRNDHHQREQQPAVVVYVEGLSWDKQRGDGGVAVIDQTHENFVPHVLPILVGATVKFLNSDDVYHNVFSYSPAKSFDLGRYAKGQSRSVTFDKPGVVKIYCDIHTHMSAFILVLENPFFTTTDDDGNFAIKDVPPGTYTLKAWYGRWPVKSAAVVVKNSDTIKVDFVFP